MIEALAKSGGRIDAVYYCPHEDGKCDCRKPATGLFRRAQLDAPAIRFAESVVVGDSPTDIQAGNAIGARTILVASDASAAPHVADMGLEVDAVVRSLSEAVNWILGERRP